MTFPHADPAHDAQPVRPELDPRRRRATFRAWHRGIREMDLLMGRFADREMASLSDRELEAFEALLEEADDQVYAWVSGRDAAPADIDAALLARLGTYRP